MSIKDGRTACAVLRYICAFLSEFVLHSERNGTMWYLASLTLSTDKLWEKKPTVPRDTTSSSIYHNRSVLEVTVEYDFTVDVFSTPNDAHNLLIAWGQTRQGRKGKQVCLTEPVLKGWQSI